MKFRTLILVSYSATLLGCEPAKKPQSLNSSSHSAEVEENIGETVVEEGETNPGEEETKRTPAPEAKTDAEAGKGDDHAVDTKPIPVPVSNKVVYRPLGLTSGGYAAIRDAKWPDKCVKGDIVPTTGALFPFNQTQTLVVRGPLVMSDLVVYQKKGNAWTRLSDISDLTWQENNFGTIQNLGTYPKKEKVLENGREIFTHLPQAGEKIIVVKIKMPMANTPVYNSGQDNVPAVWLLNSRIFEAPSAQYFCNCRGVGNPGGCGEIDIAEIIPENKSEVTTTLYSYEGARGGILANPRPTNNYQIYATVLRSDGTAGEVAVLEAENFDFSLKEIADSFVSQDWLPSAKALNKGSEALNPPR